MTARRIVVVLLCLISAVLSAGCWDRLEIEDRAALLAIGIDPGPGGNGLHISAQIGIPGKIPLGPGGGGGGAGGTSTPRETVFVDAADGPTVEAALASLQRTLNNELFLGHLRIIVVNEQLARQGLTQIIDYFHRSSEVRRTSWLLVSSNPAADVLNASPSFSRVPALYFTDMMEHYVNMGMLPPLFLGTYLVSVADRGQDATLPYVWAQGQGSRLVGAAVFHQQQMVDVSDPSQLQYLEDVIGPRKGDQYLTVAEPGTSGGQVRIKIIGRQAQVGPSLVKGRPHVDIHLRLEGTIDQEVGGKRLDAPKELKDIAEVASAQVQQGIQQLLAQTQRDHADVFGFGEQFRGKKPGFFRSEVGTKETWETEYYPQLDATVMVRILIRRVGMENR